jgi:CBS domain containing-hemolysin-like protein
MHSVNKPTGTVQRSPAPSHRRLKAVVPVTTLLVGVLPGLAQASMFKGEALDTAADIMSWVVLIVAPVIGITVFWLVHIMPEKIAHQRKHPQIKAIQTLCLLSLFFGGLLWPLAWLWAYSKPVLYKMAYGTDSLEHGDEHGDPVPEGTDGAQELQRLRQQIVELESRLANGPEAGKV